MPHNNPSAAQIALAEAPHWAIMDLALPTSVAIYPTGSAFAAGMRRMWR
jgi:hypothetical protein